jgi:hypothetical protein
MIERCGRLDGELSGTKRGAASVFWPAGRRSADCNGSDRTRDGAKGAPAVSKVAMNRRGLLFRLSILLVAAFCLVRATDAYGCMCVKAPTREMERRAVKAERDRSRAVFLGQVVAVTTSGWTFRIEGVWKGEIGAEITLVNPRPRDANAVTGWSSCDGGGFELGAKYVVFAFGRTNTDMRRGDACSQTRGVLRSDDTTIKLLDELARTDPVVAGGPDREPPAANGSQIQPQF